MCHTESDDARVTKVEGISSPQTAYSLYECNGKTGCDTCPK
jgi:hypothetical protein